MKRKIYLLLLFFFISTFIKAQTINSDSLAQIKKIDSIRENVQSFFKSQHKRFKKELKALDQEYAIYFTPEYNNFGNLNFLEFPMDGLDLLNIEPKYLEGKLKYYKPTHFEKPLNFPPKLYEYVDKLFRRTHGNWCEEKFGYKNLETKDEFGILLIFSPENIPDSLSALKLEWYIPSDYNAASENKKRMMDLWANLIRYHAMGDGLNERFITIVLKY